MSEHIFDDNFENNLKNNDDYQDLAPDYPNESEPSQQRLPQHIKWGLRGIAILLVGILLIQAVRIGANLYRAYQSAQQVVTILQADLTAESYATAQAELAQSATAVANAKSAFNFFTPLLHRLHWLPLIGEDLAVLPTLFNAGQELSDLAVNGFALTEPLLLAPVGQSPLTQLPEVYAAAEPELAAMRTQVDALHQELGTIDPTTLSPILREPVEQLQAAVGLMAPGLRLSEYLPAILGVGETRTYLVLAQNNHELRATGGFLTAVGRISLLDGRVVGIEFVDSYDRTISRTDLPLPKAPQPVQQHMGIEIMLLRDANWSPDFPTTAQIARTIYNQQTGRTVDGIISIDLHAVELFIKVLEPLKIAGVKEPLTGATVLEQLTAFWAAPPGSEATLESGDAGWWKQRKDFIPKLMDAALNRVQSGQFDYLRMLSATQSALDTRAVQLWFANPELTTVLEEVGWDGGLQPPREGDFLAVVDTNFGYNKVNAVIEESVAYQVTWPDGPNAPATAILTVIYRHPLDRQNYTCDQTPHYEGSYEEMMMRCYFDYVRIYTPPGSELIGFNGLQPETVTSQRGEGGSQLFGGYFILSPGTEHSIAFQYQLPAGITPENYTLTVRRQSGTGPLPFQAQVNQEFVATTIEGGTFVWP